VDAKKKKKQKNKKNKKPIDISVTTPKEVAAEVKVEVKPVVVVKPRKVPVHPPPNAEKSPL
jgi:hypothetical protein